MDEMNASGLTNKFKKEEKVRGWVGKKLKNRKNRRKNKVVPADRNWIKKDEELKKEVDIQATVQNVLNNPPVSIFLLAEFKKSDDLFKKNWIKFSSFLFILRI